MSGRTPPSPRTRIERQMKKWFVVLILGAAQFVMVLDGTVMNVSISAVVEDLDSTRRRDADARSPSTR